MGNGEIDKKNSRNGAMSKVHKMPNQVKKPLLGWKPNHKLPVEKKESNSNVFVNKNLKKVSKWWAVNAA